MSYEKYDKVFDLKAAAADFFGMLVGRPGNEVISAGFDPDGYTVTTVTEIGTASTTVRWDALAKVVSK